MKQILKVAIGILILFSFMTSGHAQSTEPVTIVKSNGDTISFTTTLRNYKGNNVFPGDTKEYIKGSINDKKIKLLKSEIQSIRLADNTEYTLEKVGWKYYIGYYITNGEINVFKTYNYDNTGNFSSPPPFLPREGAEDISKDKENYSTRGNTTLNKTALAEYYNVRKGIFYLIVGKRDFKQLSENSSKFSSYIEQNGYPKNDGEFEAALIYYNEECKE